MSNVKVSELPDELKALTQVAELDRDAQYIFRIDKSLSEHQANHLHDLLESRGIRGALIVHGTDIKVYKIDREV